MAWNDRRGQGRGGYSNRGDRRDSNPDDQRSTRNYGNGGGGRGGGGGGGGNRGGWDPLWQHKGEPVQYAENSFAVVSAYAMRPNDRFPQARAFIDIRDFFMAEQQNGGQFMCATSRGLKVPIEEARALANALIDVIGWVENVHPEVNSGDDFRRSTQPQRAPQQHASNDDGFGDFNNEPEEAPF